MEQYGARSSRSGGRICIVQTIISQWLNLLFWDRWEKHREVTGLPCRTAKKVSMTTFFCSACRPRSGWRHVVWSVGCRVWQICSGMSFYIQTRHCWRLQFYRQIVGAARAHECEKLRYCVWINFCAPNPVRGVTLSEIFGNRKLSFKKRDFSYMFYTCWCVILNDYIGWI